MRPNLGTETVRIVVPTNGYDGTMSCDAAGITACLFACSHLSFEPRSDPCWARQFHALRVFAITHPEATEIFGAID